MYESSGGHYIIHTRIKTHTKRYFGHLVNPRLSCCFGELLKFLCELLLVRGSPKQREKIGLPEAQNTSAKKKNESHCAKRRESIPAVRRGWAASHAAERRRLHGVARRLRPWGASSRAEDAEEEAVNDSTTSMRSSSSATGDARSPWPCACCNVNAANAMMRSLSLVAIVILHRRRSRGFRLLNRFRFFFRKKVLV